MWSRSPFDPLETHDHPAFNLGERRVDHQGREFIFGHYISTAPLSLDRNVVNFHENMDIQRIWVSNGADGDRCGVALAPIVNPGEYFWAQIYGAALVTVRNNCAGHTDLYTSGRGGNLDDASGSQRRVRNLFTIETGNADGARVRGVLFYPHF